MKSRFVSGLKINGVHSKFERWLTRQGYFGVSSDYPVAVHAETLIDEFLADYPDIDCYDELASISNKIGFISDFNDNQQDNDYDDD